MWNCIQETLIHNRVDLDRFTFIEQLLVYLHIHSIGAWRRDREQCPEVIWRKMQVDALGSGSPLLLPCSVASVHNIRVTNRVRKGREFTIYDKMFAGPKIE